MSPSNVERAARTRGNVLVAATDLFGRLGYDDASLVAIADRAEVSIGAVYHHWANKTALFADVVQGLHRRVADRAGIGADPPDSLRLSVTARAFLDLCADPSFARVMLYDGPAVLGERWHEIDEQWWLAGTAALLGRGGGRGSAIERRAAATAVLGALTALGRMVSADPRPAVAEACRSTAVRLIGEAGRGR